MAEKSKTNKADTLKSVSPWAHPAAQQWFELIFNRSGLIMKMRDAVENEDNPLKPDEARMMMYMIIMLGREGIWPSNQKSDLAKLTMKLGRIAKAPPASPPKGKWGRKPKPMSMDEHRRRNIVLKEIEVEFEFLRRLAGISQRKSTMDFPKSWGNFWT